MLRRVVNGFRFLRNLGGQLFVRIAALLRAEYILRPRFGDAAVTVVLVLYGNSRHPRGYVGECGDVVPLFGRADAGDHVLCGRRRVGDQAARFVQTQGA